MYLVKCNTAQIMYNSMYKYTEDVCRQEGDCNLRKM